MWNPTNRPIGVWIISTYWLFSAFLGLWIESYHSNSLLPCCHSLPPISVFQCALGALLSITTLVGATVLYLLKKEALPIFIAVLILTVAEIAFSFASGSATEFIKTMGTAGAASFYGIVLFIDLAICAYVWKLSEAGVLE